MKPSLHSYELIESREYSNEVFWQRDTPSSAMCLPYKNCSWLLSHEQEKHYPPLVAKVSPATDHTTNRSCSMPINPAKSGLAGCAEQVSAAQLSPAGALPPGQREDAVGLHQPGTGAAQGTDPHLADEQHPQISKHPMTAC